jgi:hypothetical protein
VATLHSRIVEANLRSLDRRLALDALPGHATTQLERRAGKKNAYMVRTANSGSNGSLDRSSCSFFDCRRVSWLERGLREL